MYDALQSLGRYAVRGRIGAGGMGTVLAAYDPELDRRVAIKIVRGFRDRDSLAPAGTRLRREAQSLARLSHPNVVTVYDAGFHGLFVYVVMEHVDGPDLRRWMRTATRSFEAKLEILLAAAAGLAAAHAAGIAHCDVKPENILVGDDGRVRVADFGLARLRQALEYGDTHTSERFCTPAYMAPETLMGGTVGVLTDQYSLCVTAFELLTGHRPTIAQTESGTIRELHRATRRQRAVLAVFRRGLSPDPRRRFASIDELLGEIRRLRRRRGVVELVATAAACIGVAVGYTVATAEPEVECSHVANELSSRWNARRQSVHERVIAQPHALATAAWVRAASTIDGYVEAWAEQRGAVCEDEIAGRAPIDVLARRRMCLAQGRDAVDAWTDLIADADAALVVRLATEDLGLPPLELCADGRSRPRSVPTTAQPNLAPLVAHLRRDLAEATTMRQAGRVVDSLAVLARIDAVAQLVADEPLRAEVALERGRALRIRRDDAEVETTLRHAILLAESSGHSVLRAEAWIELVDHYGRDRKLIARATALVTAADAALEAIGRPTDLAARLDIVRAEILLRDDRFEEACALYDDLAAAQPSVIDADESAHALGRCFVALNRWHDAEHWLGRALELREARYGNVHPAVAETLTAIGKMWVHRLQPARGEAPLRRALAIVREIHGDDAIQTAYVLSALGGMQSRAGALADARTSLETAARIVRYDAAASDFDVSGVLSNLGVTYSKLGMHEEAESALLDALERISRAMGPDHTRNAVALVNLGDVSERAGRPTDAARWLLRATDVLAPVPSRRGQRVRLLLRVATLLWAEGDPIEARAIATKAARAAAGTRQAATCRAWLAQHAVHEEPMLARVEERHADIPR